MIVKGAQVYEFDRRIEWWTRDSLIGVRNINYENKEETLKKMQEFVKNNTGKPYTPKKRDLIKATVRKNKKEDNNSFFCSQLILSALREAQLIETSVISNNFLPKDFLSSDFDNSVINCSFNPIQIYDKEVFLNKFGKKGDYEKFKNYVKEINLKKKKEKQEKKKNKQKKQETNQTNTESEEEEEEEEQEEQKVENNVSDN